LIKLYIFNLLLGLDQFVNTVLLGDPDDSISGRCGRAVASGKPKYWVLIFSKVIDWGALKIAGQKDHCLDSIIDAEDLTHELWSWSK
jgi:hypothetical protein